MRVIQILGPSYSGSTVLGYALNTVQGYVFGSELRRVLPAQRKKRRGQRPSCDFCGVQCKYWSDELFSAMDVSNVMGLDGLYELFSERHREVDTLVDASKTAASVAGTHANNRILCKKHPIRLLASVFYNDRKKMNIESDSIMEVRDEISASSLETMKDFELVMKGLIEKYEELEDTFPESVPFKADRAHLNNFAAFRLLEEQLGIPSQSIEPTRFSSFPCHSVGGNRAPVWISKASQSGETFDQDKFRFYQDTTSFGDWKIDNKFTLLFSDLVIDSIINLGIYSEVCDYLGYEPSEF